MGRKPTSAGFWVGPLIVGIVTAAIGIALVEVLRLSLKHEVTTVAPSQKENPPNPDLFSIAEGLAATKETPDRRLTAEQVGYMRRHLVEFQKQPVQVNYVIGDVESQQYAQDFVDVLGTPPLNWQAGTALTTEFSFLGVAVSVQDPSEVPQAAEKLATTLQAMGVKVARVHDPDSADMAGNKPSTIFSLLISKKGESSFSRGTKPELSVRSLKAETPADKMSNLELRSATLELADAMRAFEGDNKEALENEWHVVGTPVERGSYRYEFEQYRRRALELRAELQKRLKRQPATTIALDSDSLAGPSPIADAANDLESLAKQMPEREANATAGPH